MALFRDARGNLRYVADDYGSMVSDIFGGAAEGVRGALQEKTFTEAVLPFKEAMMKFRMQQLEELKKELRKARKEDGQDKDKDKVESGQKSVAEMLPEKMFADIVARMGAQHGIPGMEGPGLYQSPANIPAPQQVPQMFPSFMAPPDTSKSGSKKNTGGKSGQEPKSTVPDTRENLLEAMSTSPFRGAFGSDPLVDFISAP